MTRRADCLQAPVPARPIQAEETVVAKTLGWGARIAAVLAVIAFVTTQLVPPALAAGDKRDGATAGKTAPRPMTQGWHAQAAASKTVAKQDPATKHVNETEVLPWAAPPPRPEYRAPPRIDWQVENSFRFFGNASDTALHRATYEALSEEERKTPILSAERALQRRHPDGWAADQVRRLCHFRGRGGGQCGTRGDYINPRSHKIVAQLLNVAESKTVDCTWKAVPLNARRRGGVKKLTLPCDTAVKFDVPYPSGLSLSVSVGGQPVAETRVKVEDLLIVGMGDSFGSGEGNPDVPVRFSRERTANYGEPSKGLVLAGYPARVGAWREIGDRPFIEQRARWVDQACHRSLYSHQLRAALQIAVEEPQKAVTYVGLACSGAETTFGLFLYYKGNEWVPQPPEYSQISAAAVAQCGRHKAPNIDLPEAYHMSEKLPELKGLVLRRCDRKQSRGIDLLFLSVGGNDIGFARLVANAVLSNQSMLKKLGGWFGSVHGAKRAKAALRRLRFRYKSLNRAMHNILHIPWRESRRIILTGYPRMAMMRDGKSVCPDGRAGMTVAPAFSLSSRKAAEGGHVADMLHREMKAAARKYKWSFVEAHRRAFIGRGICAGANSIVGMSPDNQDVANDLRLPRKLNGVWQPYNPADWRAYASRQRWFRTPNDAFMTGNFHVRASLLQKALRFKKLSWFQLMLASTYSGAFHPTAEGQAAIADALVVKARQVLKSYK